MLPWIECPQVEVDWSRPIGQRFDAVPPALFAKGKRLLQAIMQEFPAGSKLLADVVRLRTAGRFHKEACALARKVDVDWREVMLANVSYDLALAVMGCSTVALPTPEGPVLVRNMDWWPEDILAQTSCLVRVVQDQRLVFANAGWPGTIGVVSGMSGRGFALALNAVLSPEGMNKTGYPVLLHLRRVLEDAAGFDDAVQMVSEEKLATSCLITIVGTENHQRVVIERTPTKAAQRRPTDGQPLVTTNDYRLMYDPQPSDAGEIYQTTCARYDALSQFFADHGEDDNLDDAALLYILSDPTVVQTITAQHVIMRPRSGRIQMWVPRRLI